MILETESCRLRKTKVPRFYFSDYKVENKEKEDIKNQIMFYKSGEFSLLEKPIPKSEKPKDVEKIVLFPVQILELFEIDKITDEFSEFVRTLKDSFQKREMEERERRQLLVIIS